MRFRLCVALVCSAVLSIHHAAAQTPATTGAPTPSVSKGTLAGPPRVIAMSGSLVNAAGQPHAGRATLTFALYADQQDATALWTETQTVQADERGRYTVWLGTESPLPMDLFQSTEARWLGVRNADGVEPARVRLLSVPYALKAGDAETLGGQPATAYLRAAASDAGSTTASGTVSGGAASSADADPIVPRGFENSGAPYATAYGYQALLSNTANGNGNAALGYQALLSNTDGFSNTAVGKYSLYTNTTGTVNTAVGAMALVNSTGDYNTAAGVSALYGNTTGDGNTAAGVFALYSNTTGSDNTAAGYYTLLSNTTGSRNVALGLNAGYNATGNDNVYIANQGSAGENGAIYLGTAGTHTKTVLAGNVGVGTSSPAQKLDVRGTGSTFASITGASGGNVGLILNNGSGSSALLKSNASDGAFTIETPNGSERFRVTTSGNVGIGTATPPHTLTVLANASSYVNLISAGGNAGHIFTAGGKEAVIRLNIADGSFSWENPNGTERMRITQSGNVGIGTTNPTNPLQMGSGAFVSAGGVWTNASSRALKDRIAEVSAAEAQTTVAQLTPVTYVYKASPSEAHVGFIAEDVPALVATADRKGVSAMDIVAVVTKVVQTQQATIDRQEATIQKQQETIQTQQTTMNELALRLAQLEALVAALHTSRK